MWINKHSIKLKVEFHLCSLLICRSLVYSVMHQISSLHGGILWFKSAINLLNLYSSKEEVIVVI